MVAATPQEVEIKLELPNSDAKGLRRRGAKLFGGGKPSREILSSVYFDTPKQRLRKQGFSLRVRATEHGTLQTVKAQNTTVSGLFDRSEWETEIPGPDIERAALAKTPIHKVLRKRQTLEPLFETVVDRTTWTVATGQSTVEVALDEGRVVAGECSRSFTELELELKHGSQADLFALARKLGAAQRLKLGVMTKSERGYALAAGDAPSAFKAEPLALEAGQPAAAAFRQIAHACLRQFRLNEALVIETRSVESLHETRVAMRRLRSALSLFKSLVADGTCERLKAELRTASQVLGDARNLDVYLARALETKAAQQGDEPGWTGYLDTIRGLREQAYDRVVALFDSASFRRMTIDFLAWIETGPWTSDEDPDKVALREQPIEACAAVLLRARFHKLRRRGKHLDQFEPEVRHRVRIEAKKLRYAAEFFAGLAGKSERKPCDDFVKRLKALQELLGELNDQHTGHQIAAQIARHVETSAPDRLPSLLAAKHLNEAQEEPIGPLLKRAAKAHLALVDAPRFWRAW